MSLEMSILNEFIVGAAPLIVKTAYDKIVGQTPGDLKRRIEDLTGQIGLLSAKNQELLTENASKQQTITVLTGVVEAERRDKAALMEQLAEAAKERKVALNIKNGEIRRIQADERNCKKLSAKLTERVTQLERELGPVVVAAGFTSDRVEALETGVDIGDVAAKPPIFPRTR